MNKAARRLPVVLLAELNDAMWLVASLLYGTEMRLKEELSFRVKDVEFEFREIIIKEGKD